MGAPIGNKNAAGKRGGKTKAMMGIKRRQAKNRRLAKPTLLKKRQASNRRRVAAMKRSGTFKIKIK